MKRLISITVLLLCVLWLGGQVFAEQRFTAKLPPSYEYPQTTTPAPDYTNFMGWVDVGILFAALSAASYLALKRRSRRGLIILTIVCLAYFGFVRTGCICPVGSIQNVSASLFDASYTLPLYVIALFMLPLVFTLMFGRTFCAAVCPLGAMQELLIFWPVKLPRWLGETLAMGRWLVLGLSVLLAGTAMGFLVCILDPFVPFFRLSGSSLMVTIGICVLVISLFIARPYCRFVCPYGAVLSVLSSAARRHVTITPSECIECHLCQDACPIDAIEKANISSPPRPRNEAKIRLITAIIALAVLVPAGALLGMKAGPVLAKKHRTINVAEQVKREENDPKVLSTEESLAFYTTTETTEDLYRRATSLRDTLATGAGILGGFLGLVVAIKLISLATRRTRKDYEPNRGQCVSCGRCFQSCPIEIKRRQDGTLPEVTR